MLALAGCSRETPFRDERAGGEATMSLGARASQLVGEPVLQAGEVDLTTLGVPAEKLDDKWVMASVGVRLECHDAGADDEGRVMTYASADAYNAENPHLRPVPATYSITMCAPSGDRTEFPSYTAPDGETIAAADAAAYRLANPDAQLVPEVDEGEGAGFAYFEGWTSFGLADRDNKRVDVTLSMANTVVGVEFTDTFRSYFAGGAEVVLATKAGFTAVAASYTADTEPGTVKYFWVRPQEFTLSASALRQDPSPGSIAAEAVKLDDYVQSRVAPQTLYRCVFDITGVGGTVPGQQYGITVTVNDTPVYTWDMDGEELNPNAPGAPHDE